MTVASIKLIIEKLKAIQNRDSTVKNYISIWRHLNKFLLCLDVIPEFWEDRVSYFCAYLIEFEHQQSSTVRSYISAIKHTLKIDGYEWNENRVWLGSLIKSCKLMNDSMCTRLPIQFGLFELLLFELERVMSTQPYLEILYKQYFA